MNLNLIDYSTSAKYVGNFNDVRTEIKRNSKTKPSKTLLDMKKCTMNNEQTLEELKTILSNRFGYNLELMASAMGVPVDQVYSILSGEVPVPAGVFDKLEKDNTTCRGDYIQIGDRFDFNNSVGGTVNYSPKIPRLRLIRQLRAEIAELRKESEEKDELIDSLKETNDLLKKDTRKG